MAPNPGIGLIVIGTELLTGKRRDSHFAHTVEALADWSLVLSETELGVRGHAGNVDGAISWLTEALDRGGWRWKKRAASPAV